MLPLPSQLLRPCSDLSDTQNLKTKVWGYDIAKGNPAFPKRMKLKKKSKRTLILRPPFFGRQNIAIFWRHVGVCAFGTFRQTNDFVRRVDGAEVVTMLILHFCLLWGVRFASPLYKVSS